MAPNVVDLGREKVLQVVPSGVRFFGNRLEGSGSTRWNLACPTSSNTTPFCGPTKEGRENNGKTDIDREFEIEVCWRGSYLSFSSYPLFRWNGSGEKKLTFRSSYHDKVFPFPFGSPNDQVLRSRDREDRFHSFRLGERCCSGVSSDANVVFRAACVIATRLSAGFHRRGVRRIPITPWRWVVGALKRQLELKRSEVRRTTQLLKNI